MTEVLSMVEEFLNLERLENELAESGEENKAQAVNEKKWKIKKLAKIYNVEIEFNATLKARRNK